MLDAGREMAVARKTQVGPWGWPTEWLNVPGGSGGGMGAGGVTVTVTVTGRGRGPSAPARSPRVPLAPEKDTMLHYGVPMVLLLLLR
jgi:hypothetical protein